MGSPKDGDHHLDGMAPYETTSNNGNPLVVHKRANRSTTASSAAASSVEVRDPFFSSFGRKVSLRAPAVAVAPTATCFIRNVIYRCKYHCIRYICSTEHCKKLVQVDEL